MKSQWNTAACAALIVAGCTSVFVGTGQALAAERTVLIEHSTHVNCGYCPPVGEALGMMIDAYPDTLAGVQIHAGSLGGSDPYTIPWTTARRAFFGNPGWPAWYTDTDDEVVGTYSVSQNYSVWNGNYNARVGVPTDIVLEMGAELISGTTYEISVRATMELTGTTKTMRLYRVQVLDHYPNSSAHNRNCAMDAASETDFTLNPGEAQIFTYQTTLGGASSSNLANVRFVAWVQAPGSTAPREVYQAEIMPYPFWELPNIDCNDNGVPDNEDIANGTSLDCNLNNKPDECELEDYDCNSNGIPDDCDISTGYSVDCNANGIPDACDVVSGFSQDCDANGEPDECQADCNENGTPDVCDVADGTSEDCNSNGQPDECETSVIVNETSGPLGPIGVGYPQAYTLASPAPAVSNVVITVLVQGDFGSANETLDFSLNGTLLGTLFTVPQADCADNVNQIDLTPAEFNALIAGGLDADFDMVAADTVNPNLCANLNVVTVDVEYIHYGGPNDANANGIPDDCESSPCPWDTAPAGGDNTVGLGDLNALLSNWGACPAPCPWDYNDPADGVVGLGDLNALLSNWGPCP